MYRIVAPLLLGLAAVVLSAPMAAVQAPPSTSEAPPSFEDSLNSLPSFGAPAGGDSIWGQSRVFGLLSGAAGYAQRHALDPRQDPAGLARVFDHAASGRPSADADRCDDISRISRWWASSSPIGILRFIPKQYFREFASSSSLTR